MRSIDRLPISPLNILRKEEASLLIKGSAIRREL